MDLGEDRPDREETLRRLGEIAPELETAGVTLALETYEQVSTAALVDVVETLDHPRVRICLDPANTVANLELPGDVTALCAPGSPTGTSRTSTSAATPAGSASSTPAPRSATDASTTTACSRCSTRMPAASTRSSSSGSPGRTPSPPRSRHSSPLGSKPSGPPALSTT
ncbi:TIM barrel protein [Rathayibacter oskolensis]|uniref:TIM barrel protein n=1 Tax=Rathayibacter oskolensis TaxID=1891671 RepID=UPI0026605A53|nr:TIM barrel protein [Rathayibacter oskolensis]WKK71104.1 TIM barrel protein [Rathayibacter oskolensis]